MDNLYKDMRNNRIVRIVKNLKNDVVLVICLGSKMRYLVDKHDLRQLKI